MHKSAWWSDIPEFTQRFDAQSPVNNKALFCFPLLLFYVDMSLLGTWWGELVLVWGNILVFLGILAVIEDYCTITNHSRFPPIASTVTLFIMNNSLFIIRFYLINNIRSKTEYAFSEEDMGVNFNVPHP